MLYVGWQQPELKFSGENCKLYILESRKSRTKTQRNSMYIETDMTPAFMQTIFYWGTWYLIRNGNINKCYDDREVRLRVLVTCSQTHCLPLPDVVDHLQRWPPSVPFLPVPKWPYPIRRWSVFLQLIECGLACDCFVLEIKEYSGSDAQG